MKPELVANIVISCYLGIIHVSALIIVLIWRIKKYKRGLHHTAAGFCFAFFSIIFGLFFGPISPHFFGDAAENLTRNLILCSILCTAFLSGSVTLLCFCIFIDGSVLIRRSLFTETRIELAQDGVSIDIPNQYSAFIISLKEGKIIEIYIRHVEGDSNKFIERCKAFQKID